MPVKRAAQAKPNALLRRARQERGWSQQEVADLIGAPQAFMVTRWENGTTFPGPGYREKLRTLFGKSSQELGLLKPLTELLPIDPQAAVHDPSIPLRFFQAQTLVGRDQVLMQLQEQLCGCSAYKRIAIDGLPGVGKTTLAAELAVSPEVRTYFRDGVLWAGLGPQANIQAHLHRWCTLVGISESEQASLRDCAELARALRRALWNRKMLLVLDDAWTIEDALACTVGGLNCAYLLTTRIPEVATRFAGERSLRLGELSQEEGVCLFRQIAPMVHKMEPELLGSLVQAVGGLPLAITLMGNYLLLQARHGQHRRLQAAITQLQQAEERLRLAQPQAGLECDSRLPAGTPLTLQAMIGLSEAMLSERERQALAMLSVFPAKPAGFSEEAALAVIAAPAEVLDRLVDVGLLESYGTDGYSLHQTIADYARSLPREEFQAEQRLVAYVVTYVEQHREEPMALEQELPLILAALELAPRVNCLSEFVQCVSAIFYSLRARGFFSLTERLLWQAYEIDKHRHVRQHLMLWYQLGSILRERGAYERADALLEEGIVLARQQEDVSSLAFLLSRRGTVAADRCEYVLAETCYREALALARQHNNLACITLTLNNLAWVLDVRGDFVQAEAGLQESLALARQERKNSGIALANLGCILGRQGKFLEAEVHLQEALTLARAAKNDLLLSAFHLYLGWTLLRQDEYTRAKQNLQEALSLAQRIGRLKIIARAFTLLALLALKEGDLEQVDALLQEGLTPFRSIGNHADMCLYLMVKGWMQSQQAEFAQARDTLQEGLALARRIAHVEYIPTLLFLLGSVTLNLGELELAYALLQEGLELTEQNEGICWLKGMGLNELGRYYLLRGKYQQATASYQEILTSPSSNYRSLGGLAHEGLARTAAEQGEIELATEHAYTALHIFEEIGHGRAHAVRGWLSLLLALKVERDV